MSDKKTIGLACDHAGYEMKEFVKSMLVSRGYECIDFGTNSTESVDYPDFVCPLVLHLQ